MKFKIVLMILCTYLIVNSSVYANHTYENIAITEQSIEKDNEYIGSKIEIHKINHLENKSSEIGELIWTIVAENLPVDIHLCYKYTFDPCSSPGCVAPCLRYGPRFVNYDEKNNRIYFAVNSSAVGATGMGLRFIFMGDINSKKIKYLTLVSGPLETVFSPSNRYLVFYGLNIITVYDSVNNTSFLFGKDNIWKHGHDRLYGLGDIHWLSDTRFTYTESWRPDKFSSEQNDNVERTYDIPMRKIISSRKI